MRLNCGDNCPKSGAYNLLNAEGKVLNTVYVDEGQRMPPAPYSDCYYESEE